MEDGWSIKKLHRSIVMSERLPEVERRKAQARAADPENRLLARANRRRLEFEALRDSLLAGVRQARPEDGRAGGGHHQDAVFRPRARFMASSTARTCPTHFARSISPVPTPPPQRYQTTVPQQALFLLNSPFLLDQVRTLLARPEIGGERCAGHEDSKALSARLCAESGVRGSAGGAAVFGSAAGRRRG